MMLLFKADPNMKMHYGGFTPLYIASSHNRPGAAIVKALLNAKANPELPNDMSGPEKEDGGTPLHAAVA